MLFLLAKFISPAMCIFNACLTLTYLYLPLKWVFSPTSFKPLISSTAITISSFIDLLSQYSIVKHSMDRSSASEVMYHSLFLTVANHLKKVANTQVGSFYTYIQLINPSISPSLCMNVVTQKVRNAATWAGNLMINMKYKNFPSDVILALGMANALIEIIQTSDNPDGIRSSFISIETFLSLDYTDFIGSRCLIKVLNKSLMLRISI